MVVSDANLIVKALVCGGLSWSDHTKQPLEPFFRGQKSV